MNESLPANSWYPTTLKNLQNQISLFVQSSYSAEFNRAFVLMQYLTTCAATQTIRRTRTTPATSFG